MINCSRFLVGILLLLSAAIKGYGQLSINHNVPSQQIVEDYLIGDGILVDNVQIGAGTDFRQYAVFENINSALPIQEGVMITTGFAEDFAFSLFNIEEGFTSFDLNNPNTCPGGGICGPGDADLSNLLVGNNQTFDAAILEFDFTPESDIVQFRYVFASEEYNEFVCSEFNDVFAFYLSGPGMPEQNIALIPNTNIPVAINTINNGNVGSEGNIGNCLAPAGSLNFDNFYIDNTFGQGLEFDGMTVTLEAVAEVIPCSTYHIKLAVADVGDGAYDSAVFFEMGSFSSTQISTDIVISNGDQDSTIVEDCSFAEITFQLSEASATTITFPLTISGTAQEGIDYENIPDSITFFPGQTEVVIDIIPITDATIEGEETIEINIANGLCNPSDASAFLKINEEVVLDAPVISCNSTDYQAITFSWDVVEDATGYQVSLDSGQTWIPANSPPLSHEITGLNPGETQALWVQAIGGTPECQENGIDSTVCVSCALNVEVSNNGNAAIEGCTTTEITFSIPAPVDSVLIFPIDILGTAIQGTDYADIPDTLIFPIGDTIVTIEIIPFLDTLSEGTETIELGLGVALCPGASVLVQIIDETVLEAPEVLCNSTYYQEITFSWDAINGATGYQISFDEGATWQTINQPPTTHELTGLAPSTAQNAWIQAIGGTPGCQENGIDSIICVSCGLFAELDSVTHLPCDLSQVGGIHISTFGGINPINYAWSNGNTTEDLINVGAGDYALTITDDVGCEDYLNQAVLAPTTPDITAYIFENGRTSFSTAVGHQIDIWAAGTNVDDNTIYLWEDPSGTGLIQNPNLDSTILIPAENGNFTYIVTASNVYDWTTCWDTSSVTLTITDLLGFPNVFTPNGDFLNDVFRPVHLAPDEIIEFKIFDRWGQKIYDDPDIVDGGWNGLYRGKEQPQEVYIYIITFQRLEDNNPIQIRGEFTLIR